MDRSRRLLLAALPAAALVSACSSGQSADTTNQAPPVPPTPGSPDEAIAVLLEGNARFAARTPAIRDTAEIERVWQSGIGKSQEPFAMVLGCADSRLAPELIFDQFVGDIFVVREAGNIAHSPTNIGSLEYGQAVLRAKALVVLGHSDCGAVNAAFKRDAPGANIQSIVDAIKPGIAGAPTLDDAIARNVGAVITYLRTNSPLLTDAEKTGAFKIVGAVYDIKTARVGLL
ncbi:MAG: carbonic anhydrase [Mycobacterium sp.]